MDGGGDDPEAMIPAGVSGVMPQGQWQTASVGARGQGCVCRDGPQPPSTGSKSGDVVTGHLWKGWISQTDKQTNILFPTPEPFVTSVKPESD